MQNYQNIYKSLVEKLKSTRRNENLFLLTNSLLKVIGITSLVIFLAIVIESIAFGDITFRTILAGAIFITFIICFGLYFIPEFLRLLNIRNNPSILDIALRVGKFYPDIKDKIGNALQLIPIHKNANGMSPELALAAFMKNYEESYNKDFNVIINKDDLKRNLIIYLIPFLLLSFSLIVFKDTFGESLFRITNFNKSFLPPVTFNLKVIPEKLTVSRGEKLNIEILINGTIPSKIWLAIKENGQTKFDVFEVKQNIEGKYFFEINSIKNTLTYYAFSEWYNEKIQSNTGIISVIDKPLIKSISGKLTYPSYTNLSPSYLDERNADITALIGSNANFNILTNKKLKSAKITFIKKNTMQENQINTIYDTIYYNMNIRENKAEGNLRITETGFYFFQLIDTDGLTVENPINYSIIAQNDYFPEIYLITPTNDIEVNNNALLSIKSKISDDYGFNSLKLYYRLAESPYTTPDEKFSSIDIPINSKELSLEVPYIWNLNKLNIMPDDKFEFYLEVADNDIVNGPKKSKTQTIAIRLPSLREIQREAELTQEKIQQDLEKIMNEANEIKKDIEELNRELLKEKNIKKEANWSDKKKTEEIAKKQQELKDKLNDIQKKLEQTTEKLQDNNLISQETLEKYLELQKLMKQVDSPELRMMQQRMQDALKNMSQEELQKAMENFKFNDEQFRQAIERSMKLLKRIQAEQKTEGLKKRAEELAKQQDELANETKDSDLNNQQKQEELSKRQEKLKNELNSINKELNDLEKLMKEVGEEQMPMDELKESIESLKFNETSSEMQNAQQNIKKNDKNQANKSQKKASQNLKDFADKMNQMRENMRKQNIEETIQKMQKSISDLLELSKRQEKVKGQTDKSDYNSTSLPQFAQNQAQLFESLASVAKFMSELSQKSFAITSEMGIEIANALKEMRNAIEKMADRNPRQAAQSQQIAMSSINKTIGQMQDMLENLKQQSQGSCNNPGGAGGGMGEGNPMNMGQGMSFSQRMQQLAAEQQAVNEAIQRMLQGGSSGQGKEQLEKQAQQSRISDKQGSAQKTIDELIKEQKQFGGDKKKLDELEKISQEMKEILTEFKSKGPSSETLKRQERILSRLLDLQRSENERDYEKQREGKTAEDIFAPSPSALNLKDVDKDKYFRDLLKNNQQGFTKDYENLIKNYFERLKNK